MKFCEDCDHWQFVYNNGLKRIGTCSNEDVQGNISMVNEAEHIDEDAQIYTAATFGCIYWEKGDKGVVVIKKQ